jgi:hypothetical protein
MIKSRFAFPRFLAAASVLLCVVSSAKAQDKVLLRLHLHPGQTFDQGMAMEKESFEVIQNRRIHKTETMNIGFHDAVLSVGKDGTVKWKTTFQSLVMKSTTTNDGKIVDPTFSYDSTEHLKSVPLGLQPMAAAVGRSVVLTISSRGKILKIEGIDALVKNTGTDIKVPFIRAMLQGAVKDFLNITSKQSRGVMIFAQPPVPVGSSWVVNLSLPISESLNMKYTLMSSKNGIATIAALSHIKSSLTGTVNGVIRVDEKTGLVISSELHKHIGAKPTIPESKNGVKGKSNPAADLPFSIYSKSTMRSWTVKLPQ